MRMQMTARNKMMIRTQVTVRRIMPLGPKIFVAKDLTTCKGVVSDDVE